MAAWLTATTDDGWSVETVILTCTPNRHDGEWLRIRYCGYFVHDARTISELERYVSLAELQADVLVTLGLPTASRQELIRARHRPRCPRL
jgi:hypothetical protein